MDVINTVLLKLAPLLVDLLVAVISYEITVFVVPWLKEKQLYSTICKFVAAAYKLSSAGTIPKEEKLSYVERRLTERGVRVTPLVRALIESAVVDLDLKLAQLAQQEAPAIAN